MFFDHEMLAILGISVLTGATFYLVAAFQTGVFQTTTQADEADPAHYNQA